MAQMCGGTSAAKEADAEIQEICDKIRADLEQKEGKTFEEYIAVMYKSQVVAGTNFFVKIKVGGDYVHVRIFRPLPHTGEGPSYHSHLYPKAEADDIQFF